MRGALGAVVKARALGIIFLALVMLSLWLTWAVFNQKFTDYVPVTLESTKAGLQLPQRADVKLRGMIVGQVREITSTGDGAMLELGLQPDKVELIPANVTALVLPKTLFGEKFVSLQMPDSPSGDSLEAGDRITQSQVAIETEKVLADLYPLLRAVNPEDLSYTLNALSTALEGRGEKLGQGLVTLDGYLTKLNPQIPGAVRDLKLLTQVSDNYSEVLPELGRLLSNSVTTGNTIVEKDEQIHALYRDVASFSSTTRDFLEANGDNIIRLGDVSVPTLALLERMSPEYPCLFQGLANWAPRVNQTFRDHTLHINLELIPHQPPGYNPPDKPRYGSWFFSPELKKKYGPYCGSLPNTGSVYGQENPPPEPWFLNSGGRKDDGVDAQHKRTAPGFGNRGLDLTSGFAGTAAERQVVNAIAAPVMGVSADEVPDVATLLFGPLARGSEVSMR